MELDASSIVYIVLAGLVALAALWMAVCWAMTILRGAWWFFMVLIGRVK